MIVDGLESEDERDRFGSKSVQFLQKILRRTFVPAGSGAKNSSESADPSSSPSY
jgi:hypothetical protein